METKLLALICVFAACGILFLVMEAWWRIDVWLWRNRLRKIQKKFSPVRFSWKFYNASKGL